MKLLKNHGKFKQYYEDELKYEEARIWWEDNDKKDSDSDGFRIY